MYNILDLLNKAVTMKDNAYNMYREISKADNLDDSIKLVAKVLATQENKNIQACNKLKARLKEEELPTIDFDIYDKASNLISGFIYPDQGNIKSINDLLNLALDFQKNSISLMISIQGLIIRDEKDKLTITYDILSDIIAEEEKRIENIEKFLK